MRTYPNAWPERVPDRDDVYVVQLRVGDVPVDVRSILSSEEKERARAFNFDADRNLYIAARGALRLVLGRFLDTSAADVELSFNDHGKPCLVDSDLEFSVSHSNDLVLLGFAMQRRVGIDVEAIDSRLPMQDLVARFFSPAERSVFDTLSQSARVGFFFETWTRKEAYVKAMGEGLSIPPETFTVTGDDGRVPVEGVNGIWATEPVATALGFAAAVAVEASGWSQKSFDIAGIDG